MSLRQMGGVTDPSRPREGAGGAEFPSAPGAGVDVVPHVPLTRRGLEQGLALGPRL